MDNSNTFGKKLKYLRTLKGFTQAQLAELAGLHEKHISKLEIGVYQPSYETQHKILKVLGASSNNIDTFINEVSDNDNPFFIKSIQILNNASDSEIEFYYGLLKQAQKGIELIKDKLS